MARAVPLDPGEYAGTYKAIGGAISLDFANLVSFRDTADPHDWLEPAGNLAIWASDVAGETAVRAWRPTPELIEQAMELREELSTIFTSLAASHSPPERSLAKLTAATRTGRSHQELTVQDHRVAWTFPHRHPPGCRLLDTIALDAAHVLTAVDPDRLRACSGCGWVFLDTSPAGRRQWCDPADCGNRARQRRHYHRARQQTRPDDTPAKP